MTLPEIANILKGFYVEVGDASSINLTERLKSARPSQAAIMGGIVSNFLPYNPFRVEWTSISNAVRENNIIERNLLLGIVFSDAPEYAPPSGVVWPDPFGDPATPDYGALQRINPKSDADSWVELPSAVSAMKDMLVHGKLSVWVASEDDRGYTYIRIALGRSLDAIQDKSPTPLIKSSKAWFLFKKEQS
jgi:hypothetical protein